MAKTRSHYVCQSCGASHLKWGGKCDACGEWNSLAEEITEAAPPKSMGGKKGRVLAFEPLSVEHAPPARMATGIGELDRVLGGGLVGGSSVLVGGDPGIGKSTLLLQAAAKVAASGLPAAYISGEESADQIRLRASRLGLSQAPLGIAAAASVRDILASLEDSPPALVIVDSVQTMYVDALDSAPGTVAQVRAASHELIRFAKKRGSAVILVGHVTKDGQIAGPRVMEHMVDCVLYFEGERSQMFRILRAVKNRYGATDEIGVFEMTGSGLAEVANPSSLFLPERDRPVSGSAIFAGLEGTRPVLVEIQALVTPSPMATPRRAVIGWDAGRLAMLLAVLEARAGFRLSDQEIYVNVAGGLRLSEPAADLAVIAALLSAAKDCPLPAGAVFFGEVSLSGEVRPTGSHDARLREAEKLGFTRAYTPTRHKARQPEKTDLSLGITPVAHVEEMLTLAV